MLSAFTPAVMHCLIDEAEQRSCASIRLLGIHLIVTRGHRETVPLGGDRRGGTAHGEARGLVTLLGIAIVLKS